MLFLKRKVKGNDMEQNKIYYSNEEGKGSRVTRDLVAKLFMALSENLSSECFINFLSRSRVPNERELYGLFVKSLIESCGDDLGHIATEFQVLRASDDSENEDSKGRVDLIFDFRSVSFLVELKVGRVNAINDHKDPKNNARKKWHNAIEQLSGMRNEAVNNLLKNKVVRLPIALYFLESRKPEKAESINLEIMHQNIFDFVGDEKLEFEPHFELYSEINPEAPTRLRATELDDSHNNYIYGFSIFAKQMNEE